MLEKLADADDLAGGAELLLDGVEGLDGGLRAVRAQEVPGVEAREILQGPHNLVTTDWCLCSTLVFFVCYGKTSFRLSRRTGGRDKAQVMRQRRVVDNSVCDHFGGLLL